MVLGFLLKLLGKGAPATDAETQRSPPPGAQPLFNISYKEDFGVMTRRDVFPIRMYATEEGIRGWCYLTGELRLFKFSQMHGVHDNTAGRDIKVRGLWEWCGLPETDIVFPDEEPGAIKQTQWQKKPDHARFRVVERVRGKPNAEWLFSPSAWGSHRRSMVGVSWPDGDHSEIDFASVIEATDLESGEVLDRIGLWRLVLAHREDAPPWYVQWADQHLMLLCMIGFARKEWGKFTADMRSSANTALVEGGFLPVDDEGFKSITQSTKAGYGGYESLEGWIRLLDDSERAVCMSFANAIQQAKDGDLGRVAACFGKPKASL